VMIVIDITVMLIDLLSQWLRRAFI
jgi:ABC-type phosphate/phosphonate transport system permease subunit